MIDIKTSGSPVWCGCAAAASLKGPAATTTLPGCRAGGVIVVSVDFRLGIYGFFGHPGLAGSGTFGLHDQQSALRWVRDNVGAFGGDPHNVTLFGQSGGSIGTCAQLTSPSSAGLFQRAILQSGPCGMHWPPSSLVLGAPAGSFVKPLAQVEQSGSKAAAALDCRREDDTAELDCLRLLPTTALDSQFAAFAAAASRTALLPLASDAALRLGRFHRMPVLSGHTSDEHRLVAGIFAAAGSHISAQQYPGLIRRAYGNAAPAVLARYPVSRYGGDGALAWSAAFTDSIWACEQIDSENALSRYVPTYTYEFADEHAQPFADLPADFAAGASHASELPDLFEVAGRKPISSDYCTDEQRRLAGRLIDYWTGFARTGRPVSAGAADDLCGAQRYAEGPSRTREPDQRVGPRGSPTPSGCSAWRRVRRKSAS
ncbi:carboxylesterase family protein [Actinoplanes sp. NPDC051343]|uniref:carboxylesterase family protein n=1 Tax=Actinoplanes sp. NPDC051343 TaxID=3363906 RepID=UPI00379D0352